MEKEREKAGIGEVESVTKERERRGKGTGNIARLLPHI